MADEETPLPSRVGSSADLARRMDRMESRQDGVEAEVRTLTATVIRVEQNQNHAEELNKYRFSSLDTALGLTKATVDGVRSDLEGFMRRIEGIVSGEVETAQGRQGAAILAEYTAWRKNVEERLPDDNEVKEYRDWRRDIDAFVTQGKTLALLVRVVVAGNAIAIIAAIAAILK